MSLPIIEGGLHRNLVATVHYLSPSSRFRLALHFRVTLRHCAVSGCTRFPSKRCFRYFQHQNSPSTDPSPYILSKQSIVLNCMCAILSIYMPCISLVDLHVMMHASMWSTFDVHFAADATCFNYSDTLLHEHTLRGAFWTFPHGKKGWFSHYEHSQFGTIPSFWREFLHFSHIKREL